MCEICGFKNGIDDVPNPFTPADANGVINGVWNGEITKYKLPVSVYAKTAKNLTDAVDKGFKKAVAETQWGAPDVEMLQNLTDNIYMFSGAKTYQQVRAMSDLLKQTEYKTNFYKFKEAAGKVFSDYNSDYLKAEYNTAKAGSRMGGEWTRIQKDKDVLPYLQYQTVGDMRVRPEHVALDGIIRKVDDKFWTELYPPNGWNCRCSVISLSEGEETNLTGRSDIYDNVPPEFRMNTGIDGYVFKEKGADKHPYFKVPKVDKAFAKTNFGLPVPEAKNPK